MGMIMKNLDDLQTWLENVGSILFSPTCCPYDVIFKLFVGFITSNFMMCKSFDGRYVCVVHEEH
jgi:hypothetical protein